MLLRKYVSVFASKKPDFRFHFIERHYVTIVGTETELIVILVLLYYEFTLERKINCEMFIIR